MDMFPCQLAVCSTSRKTAMSLPAARITDFHACPLVNVLVPHVGGPIIPPGKPTVLIGNLPAATVTAQATCVGPIDVVLPPGAPTVLIGGLPAARITDMTAHGGLIMLGCFTVLIGSAAGSEVVVVREGGGGSGGPGSGPGRPAVRLTSRGHAVAMSAVTLRPTSRQDLDVLVEGSRLWAILDACDEPGVPRRVRTLGPERACCLWEAPRREEDLAVAPFLVHLDAPLAGLAGRRAVAEALGDPRRRPD